MVRLIKESSWDTDFLHEVIWKLEDIFSDFGIESDYFNFQLDSNGDFGTFEMRLYVNDRQLELGKLEVRYYGDEGKFEEVVARFDLSGEAEKFCGKDFYRWATEDFHEDFDELYSYVKVTASKIIDCYRDWYGINPIEDEEFEDEEFVESTKRNKRRMKESAGKREVWFTDLGYFSKQDCERIKSIMDGKTIYRFNVIYSNQAGNCSLGVEVDKDLFDEDGVRDMFLHYALSQLGR